MKNNCIATDHTGHWLSTLRAKITLTKKVQTFIWDTALKTFHQDIVFLPQQPDMSRLFCLLFWFILARDYFCWQFDKWKLYTVILASYLGVGRGNKQPVAKLMIHPEVLEKCVQSASGIPCLFFFFFNPFVISLYSCRNILQSKTCSLWCDGV